MDVVLSGPENVGCYMHDVIISGDSEEKYLMNICKVLDRLQTYNIKVNIDKCKFLCETV